MNAFMIMWHKNVQQVIRLAERCATDKTDVYIHSDVNVPKNEYSELVAYASRKANIYLTAKRYHGVLDTRSLCDIAFEMIKCAKQTEKETGRKYGYFALLSGQDYLLKPMIWIEKELEEMYPQPLIDCTPYAKTNWIYHKFADPSLLLDYHRWINELPKGLLRKCFRVTELICRKIMRQLSSGVYKELCNEEVALYGGSAWWILPDQAIDYILDETEKKPTYVQTLLNETNTPEETFFQVMTMRSPVAKMVDVNHVDMVAQNCKTWAYFADEGKPFKGHPYVFTEREYEKLKTSSFWIARKFDITVDSKILDLLDVNLLKEE